MKSFFSFLKSTGLKAALIGAFGGMAPELIKLIPKLLHNEFPNSGSFFAFGLLALFGLIIVVVYQELDLKKALILGAGAPALIASLTATAVGPNQGNHTGLLRLSFHDVALAQVPEHGRKVKIVVNQNESPFRNNELWIRGNDSTIKNYWTAGDTLTVLVPADVRSLKIDLPSSAEGLLVPITETDTARPLNIDITDQQNLKSFWQVFGGAKVQQYKVVTKEK